MTNSSALASILTNLQAERAGLADQLTRLDAAITALGKVNGGADTGSRRGVMSAAGRRRISLAQKRRWAKVKGTNSQASQPKARRAMSAGARRKIAAAQKARWAKFRAQQKRAA